MSWIDRLVPADFDGAPFKVLGVDRKSGRRTAVQEFPGRRRVEVQDLSGDEPGGNALEFTVQAYLIGPNYDFDRDVLESALATGGVRPLTIPWRGTKNVTVTSDIVTRESKSEGGYCTVNFTCVEDVPEDPFTRVDRRAALRSQSDAATSSARADLSSRLRVSGLSSSSRLSAVDALASASAALASGSDRIASAGAVVNSASREVTAFSDAAESLLESPAALGAALADTVGASLGLANAGLGALRAAATRPLRLARYTDLAINAVLSSFAFADGFAAVPEATPNGQREAENRRAIVDATRVMVMAEGCRLLTTLPFESYGQARSTRSRMVAALDAALDDAGDGVFDAIRALRAAMITHMDSVAAALPEIRTYTTRRMITTSEIAHEVYGDGGRADDIAERNGLGRPLFVPAGTTLELLRSGA